MKVHRFTEIRLECNRPGKVSLKCIPANADIVGFKDACNVHA